MIDPSPGVGSPSKILDVTSKPSKIDGRALACTSSNTILSISSEKQHSAYPAALIMGKDLDSPSPLSRLGRLTLTSFDETGCPAPTDDMAVVGKALLRCLSLYGSQCPAFEWTWWKRVYGAVAGVGKSTAGSARAVEG